jgi:hypothetical protein
VITILPGRGIKLPKVSSPEQLGWQILTDAIYKPHEMLELPSYDTQVKKVVPDPENSYDCEKYGNVSAQTAIMTDNTRYPMRVSTPKDLRSDTAIGDGTAWWVGVDLEHTCKNIRSSMKAGYKKITVGPPSGVRAEDVSLSKAVHDNERILDYMLPRMGVNTEQIIRHGESRDAVRALGGAVARYAGERKVPLLDITGPPAPRAYTDEERPEVIKHAFVELANLRHTAWEALKEGELHNYLISLMPRDISHATNSARMLPSFLNGEAGLIADESDKEAAIYVVECLKDFWASIPEYEKKFADRKHVQHEYIDEYHITGIASSKTRRNRHARMVRLTEVRGFDGSFDNIDYTTDVFSARFEPSRPRSNVFGLPLPNFSRTGSKKAA